MGCCLVRTDQAERDRREDREEQDQVVGAVVAQQVLPSRGQ